MQNRSIALILRAEGCGAGQFAMVVVPIPSSLVSLSCGLRFGEALWPLRSHTEE
jgi:hypothetical protein